MERNPDAGRHPRRRSVAAAAGLAALAATLCAAVPALAASPAAGPAAGHGERLLAPVDGAAPSTTSADRVLARVAHGNHRLTFVEHRPGGLVGVYEGSPLGTTPYLAGMADVGAKAQSDTALELYMAVSTVAPPPELVADHARRQAGPPEAISLPPLAGTNPADGSCLYNEAIAFGTVWALNWHNGIGQQHDLHAELSFLDDINGNVGKVYDANRSSARWLAACNGGNFEGHEIYGHPDIYLAPLSLVHGKWDPRHEEIVEPGEQEVYWSAGGPERWRLRMREGQMFNVLHQRSWAIGGAIDKPFGLVGNGG